MAEILVEQALYGSHGPGGYRFLARSPGFRDDWLPEAERLCQGFGDRPAGVACPACVFARPFGKYHVAVVQAADRGSDDAGRPGALAFHLLVLPRAAYEGFGGDPFALAERVPPPWDARDTLPGLAWPAEALPPRTVGQVQQVLRRDAGPEMLGGAQVLLDGGRVVFERPTPAPELVRGLWTLLPTATRGHLWPASFAFGNALGFDAVVVPRAAGDEFAGYVNEEQAGQYPEGRYELALQIAAEAGDQAELDALFARRSRRDTWRLAWALLAVMLVLPVVVSLLTPEPPPEPAKPPAAPTAREAALPELPPARTLDAPEQRRLAEALRQLADRLGLEPPPGATAEQLLEPIDGKLGTPDPKRDPGPLARHGGVERRLRLLLWKHGVKEFDDPKLNAVELAERLAAAKGD